MISIAYPDIDPRLARRRLGCQQADDYLRQVVDRLPAKRCKQIWTITIAPTAMFDDIGLRAIIKSICRYRGPGSKLLFKLKVPPPGYRDYYSLQAKFNNDHTVDLPIQAVRQYPTSQTEILTVELRWVHATFDFPSSLAEPQDYSTPVGLLMQYTCDHDVLLANQVLPFAHLGRQIPRSPMTWMRAMGSRLPGTWIKRVPPSYRKISPSAKVHPTAVIEGAVVGPGCHIGAHCVVRYSLLGKHVRLHDGAKVEYSVVDDNSWLMHDLVLYRCYVEPHVFLIHGPYQFSCFQARSAAFATIMMDYRPDGEPIKVKTPRGVVPYPGTFMGAMLEEHAKVLGGSLLSPGITVPKGTTIGPDYNQIIRPATIESFSNH